MKQLKKSLQADHMIVILSFVLLCTIVVAGTALYNRQSNASILIMDKSAKAHKTLQPAKSLMNIEQPTMSLSDHIRQAQNGVQDTIVATKAIVTDHMISAKESLSNISIPTVDLPEFSMPEIKIPKLEIPEITLPKFELPEFDMPEIQLPKLAMPNIQWPSINVKETLAIMGQGIVASAHSIDQEVVKFKNGLQKDAVKTNAMIETANNDTPAAIFDEIEPAAGKEPVVNAAPDAEGLRYSYEPEVNEMETEGVLVPKEKTVISSTRDGKIAKINVDNGDVFNKGDILLEYACTDAESEKKIAQAEEKLAKKQLQTTMRLLKLDLISGIEQERAVTENAKATAKADLYSSRAEHCIIRAAYNGRVVKRLANPHEYTRTDRVLMEVASDDDLNIEFLAPSRWLRWINIDAPFNITLNETGETYEANITRIYGEVDPVSQSIQIRGALKPYEARLLPGMSGNVQLDIRLMREAGVIGFLEEPRQK